MSAESIRHFVTQLVEFAVIAGALTGFGILLYILWLGFSIALLSS